MVHTLRLGYRDAIGSTLRVRIAVLKGKFLVAYHEVALHRMLQLAQIAGPVISLPCLKNGRRKFPWRKAVILGKAMHEVARQTRKLVLTLPQRGHMKCVGP